MSMALAQPSASLSVSFRDACVFTAPKSPAIARFPHSNLSPIQASFATGSPLLICRSHERKTACKAMPVSIRCEQSAQEGNSLDVWLGRLAMVGFAVAITVEIATGKGLLEVSHELWGHNSTAYGCPGSNSTGGCLDGSFYLPVSLRELITRLGW